MLFLLREHDDSNTKVASIILCSGVFDSNSYLWDWRVE